MLLVSLVGGLAVAPALHAGADAVMWSQAACGDCAAMGACIAPIPAPTAGFAGSWLPPAQPSPHLFGQLRPPETAPPKAFSI